MEGAQYALEVKAQKMSLVTWFIRRELNKGGVMPYLMMVVNSVSGYRTQIIMGVYVIVKLLEVCGALTHDQAKSVEDILLPLAGVTFAAKINNVAGVFKAVVGGNQ